MWSSNPRVLDYSIRVQEQILSQNSLILSRPAAAIHLAWIARYQWEVAVAWANFVHTNEFAVAVAAAGPRVVSTRGHWTKVQGCQIPMTSNFPWLLGKFGICLELKFMCQVLVQNALSLLVTDVLFVHSKDNLDCTTTSLQSIIPISDFTFKEEE